MGSPMRCPNFSNGRGLRSSRSRFYSFYLVGFGIAYGQSNGYFAFDMGITDRDLGLTISNKLFWFIQLGFAMAAVSIVSGAIAGTLMAG